MRPRIRLATLTLSAALAATAPGSAMETPISLGETASSAPRLAIPEATGTVEFAPGASAATVEKRVAPGQPVVHRFVAPAGAMVTIGVSSPKGDVRLALFPADSDIAFAGAGPRDGAIRWTSSLAQATEIRLYAYVDTAETPFRFEVSAAPIGE